MPIGLGSYLTFSYSHPGRLQTVYAVFAVCRRKEDADCAAWRSQCPRCHSKDSNQERCDNVKAVSAVNADCDARYGGACEVEEDAGIRPFLEPWKTRHQYGNGSKYFPNSDDRKEVHRIAELGHYAVRVALELQYLRDASAHEKRHEYGRSPVSNGFSFRAHSNLPATRSRLPMNFVQPYVAPL